MERKEFEKLVDQALEELPADFRDKLANIAIIIEDAPDREPAGALLLGLYHGVPLTERSTFAATPPDHIYLYQKNIEAVCATDAEIRRQIRATLQHEIGHYFGLRESELRDI